MLCISRELGVAGNSSAAASNGNSILRAIQRWQPAWLLMVANWMDVFTIIDEQEVLRK